MNRERLWSLVLNGTRARILRGLSDDDGSLASELVVRAEHRRLREILTDASRAGPSRGETDKEQTGGDRPHPVLEDQRDFIRQVIAVLETHRLAGDFAQLAVFAAPDALGMWHQEVPERLAALVVREVRKTLIHLPARDLARTVEHALRRP